MCRFVQDLVEGSSGNRGGFRVLPILEKEIQKFSKLQIVFSLFVFLLIRPQIPKIWGNVIFQIFLACIFRLTKKKRFARDQ